MDSRLRRYWLLVAQHGDRSVLEESLRRFEGMIGGR